MSVSPANIATVTLEITIDAPADRVWRTLTERMGDWWPEEFYAGGSPGERNVILESRPGGRMLEEWAGGGGVVWGNVITVDPGKTLQVLGHVFPDWGGPTQGYMTWILEESQGKTTLRFSESMLGNVTEASLAEKDKGWAFLWETLKAHIEGADKPVWT